jgi:hypothetical protein
VAEEVEAPTVGIEATATATTIAGQEAIRRMIDEMRAVDNYTYADYARLFDNGITNPRVNYTIDNDQAGIRAVTLEDINRVATVVGNTTRNG